MRSYRFPAFGLDALELTDGPDETPGPGEVEIDVKAMSLNYRDVLVIKGLYNPKIALPAIPLSDASGVVKAVGAGVDRIGVGDRVMTHFVSDWIDGAFERRYVGSTLGVPGPGVAAERIILPERAVLRAPKGLGFAQAATLPIAALTAWSVLVTEGHLEAGQTVLSLGTGGVSIFALQLAKAMGARVIVTSSSDEKLERAQRLGADPGINYVAQPRWDKAVLELTDGDGADIVVETGGIATMTASMKAARAGGVVGVLGGVTGLGGEVNLAPLVMKRLHVAGVLVDSRSAFERMVSFLDETPIEPEIGLRFDFEALPAALAAMEAGEHFGKIVIENDSA